MRLLLKLRRLTDIQTELVLYWKLGAGSGGLWASRTGRARKGNQALRPDASGRAASHPGLLANPQAGAERRNCIKRWMFGHTGLLFTRLFTWAVHPSPHPWRLYVHVITVLS